MYSLIHPVVFNRVASFHKTVLTPPLQGHIHTSFNLVLYYRAYKFVHWLGQIWCPRLYLFRKIHVPSLSFSSLSWGYVRWQFIHHSWCFSGFSFRTASLITDLVFLIHFFNCEKKQLLHWTSDCFIATVEKVSFKERAEGKAGYGRLAFCQRVFSRV